MIDQSHLDAVTSALTKKLTEDGKLVEAGWIAFAKMVLPEGAGDAQRRDMRAAFFAGAQHLFGSLNMLVDEDSGEEPTEKDFERASQIARELDRFIDDELSVRIHHGQLRQ